MIKPNYELLKQAFAIIDGIPSEYFHLDCIVKGKTDLIGCGTVALASGMTAIELSMVLGNKSVRRFIQIQRNIINNAINHS